MRTHGRRWVIALITLALACAPAASRTRSASHDASGVAPAPDAALARARSATRSFGDLDAAVAAGYQRHVAACVQHQPHGAMGHHHVNETLMDDVLEIEKPEILVFSNTPRGYTLHGVEYVIPYSMRGPEAEPPMVLGQRLKRSGELQLWYLHVWLFTPNPSGLFADWNPAVKC